MLMYVLVCFSHIIVRCSSFWNSVLDQTFLRHMEPFNIFELFWVSNGAGWGHGFFHLMLVPYLHFLMRGGGLSFRHPLDLDLLAVFRSWCT